MTQENKYLLEWYSIVLSHFILVAATLLLAGCGGYEEKEVTECYTNTSGTLVCSEETKYFGEAGK